MINTTLPTLTRDELLRTDPHHRAALLESYAIELLASFRPPGSAPLQAESRLAEAGINSLEVVELKFSLDELLGRESDVDMFISNPSIRQLTEEMVRAANI